MEDQYSSWFGDDHAHCFAANFVALSPISFLERAAHVYGDKTSIVYGSSVRFSWIQTFQRCLNLSSSLVQRFQISPGDIVAALAPNVPALYELHFGVPMAGAVLSALNTMLDAPTLSLLLEQLEPKLIFVDYQFLDTVLNSLQTLSLKKFKAPQVVLIPECDVGNSLIPIQHESRTLDYNDLVAVVDPEFEIVRPHNECNPISVNFTSGSTGNPKGVVYSHRAAYLNSLAEIFRYDMRQMPVFLWTVDMFRCNGWCLTWAVAALGGTNVCIRNVSSQVIFDAILLQNVTHFCGPPVILNMIADAPEIDRTPSRFQCKVNVIVAGALPNLKTLYKVEELGFNVMHGYGMTEALGPAIVRPWKPHSNLADEQQRIECREGLHNIFIEGVDVKDPKTMKSVPRDGETIGEVMFRSNNLMSGYLKNPEATQEAFRGGWYHTGDLGVRHSNGWIQMKDRAKDMIFVGGKSVSTLEVEAVLLSHPKVSEAAVVGKADAFLKEVACAFVKLRVGCGDTNPEEIIEFCGDHLPIHMVPKSVAFGDLPVNFSGKVQKFALRAKANCLDKAYPSNWPSP